MTVNVENQHRTNLFKIDRNRKKSNPHYALDSHEEPAGNAQEDLLRGLKWQRGLNGFRGQLDRALYGHRPLPPSLLGTIAGDVEGFCRLASKSEHYIILAEILTLS